MSQTRAQSSVEAATNVAIGYSISVAANIVVLPAFGYSVSFGEANAIGVVFTLISFSRSYFLRRFYNWYHS